MRGRTQEIIKINQLIFSNKQQNGNYSISTVATKHSSQRLLKPLSLNMHFITLCNLHTFIWEGMCKMCADPLTYLICMSRQMRGRVSRRVRPHV